MWLNVRCISISDKHGQKSNVIWLVIWLDSNEIDIRRPLLNFANILEHMW